jgi:methylglutaconyl-CoA hydratase
MEYTRIGYSVQSRTALITLARPEKRNALDDTMVTELTAAFSAAARDPSVKVISLRAEGPAFCAGADLEYLKRIASYDLEEHRADARRLASLFRLVYELRKPVIALVQGPAIAGGAGLASVCDFVIASREHARFGYTEVQIGFLPAIVMIFLLKRVGEGKARELVLRGNIITPDEAVRIGLATMAVPHADLASTEGALCDELISRNSPVSMGLCKEMLSKLHGQSFLDALDFATNMNAAARMTQDCQQGVEAFLAKKPTAW